MRLIGAYNRRTLAAMHKLYKEAFPKIERKPFWFMIEKRKKGFMELLALEGERGEFQGLAIMVKYGDMVLLDYFAVSSTLRGEGIGSEALRLLRQRYADKRFFLEIERTGVEAENAVQRLERKAFYIRNGMKEASLLVKLFGIEMEILTDGCEISYKEYYELYTGVFGERIMKGHIWQIASE